MSYSAEVLADSPVAYYRLGETAGTVAADVSGNSHPGTYTGGFTLAQAGALFADPDKAARFNGSTGYVTVPHFAALPTDLFSLEMWVKRGTLGTTQVLIYHGFSPAFETDNKLYFYGSGIGSAAISSSAITDAAWHHVVFTKDGTTTGSKIYVDGADVTTNVVAKTMPSSSGALLIAANAGPALFADVTLDEVAIYGTVLSPARVAAHYTAGRAVNAPAGNATAAGGFHTPKVTAVQTAGAATAAGGTNTPAGTIPQTAGTATASGGTNAVTVEESTTPATVIVAPTGEATASGGANAAIPFEVPVVIRGGGQPIHIVTIIAPTGEAFAEGGQNRVRTDEITQQRVRARRRIRRGRPPLVLLPTTRVTAPTGRAVARGGQNRVLGPFEIVVAGGLSRELDEAAEVEELLGILELV